LAVFSVRARKLQAPVRVVSPLTRCGCWKQFEISFLGIFAELLDNVGERHLCRVFHLRERLASSAMGACKTLAMRPYSLPLRKTFALEFPKPMSSALPSIPRTQSCATGFARFLSLAGMGPHRSRPLSKRLQISSPALFYPAGSRGLRPCQAPYGQSKASEN